ncbi:hypothetical protein, partial [Deinococcus aerophilus]|uniref:hypothetical protein n=1 Tax=Deinococcus aerophilus TaxID=522488 RepID=UPI001E32D4AA
TRLSFRGHGHDCLPDGVALKVCGHTLAADNLATGLNVIADCVNPVTETRLAWSTIAVQAGVQLLNVEVICSDLAEHERRVTARFQDGSAHNGPWSPPIWEQVEEGRAGYQLWTQDRLVCDTASRIPDDAADELWTSIQQIRTSE